MNELRRDYVLDRWVIVSTGRGGRPQEHELPSDEGGKVCYFCPGNEDMTPPEIMRVEEDGQWIIRVFPNKFPAASMEESGENSDVTRPAYGKHEVIAETPVHGQDLADLSIDRISQTIRVYSERSKAIEEMPGIGYALVFKNKGATAGASIRHSHTQIIALEETPTLVRQEAEASAGITRETGECPYCRIAVGEAQGERRIFEDEHVSAFAPYSSRFQYEAWIMPKRHAGSLDELGDSELNSMARALKMIVGALGETNTPYNFFVHKKPVNGELHLHIEVCPRTAIMAGFELGSGMHINTVSPEAAAEFYRQYLLPETN